MITIIITVVAWWVLPKVTSCTAGDDDSGTSGTSRSFGLEIKMVRL
jgi:hypothetical protein